jgi:hypothetical protein
VEIPQPLADAGVDTAGVKVLCQGRGKADGSDYRVLDAAGKAVPFQLMFHDGARYSLISFRATNPRERFFIYFGNPQAKQAAEQIVVDPVPGAGPPKADWIPHYGLVYATIQRPEGANPKTVPEMAKLNCRQPLQTRRPVSAQDLGWLQSLRLIGLLHQHLSRLAANSAGGQVSVLHDLQRGVVFIPGW